MEFGGINEFFEGGEERSPLIEDFHLRDPIIFSGQVLERARRAGRIFSRELKSEKLRKETQFKLRCFGRKVRPTACLSNVHRLYKWLGKLLICITENLKKGSCSATSMLSTSHKLACMMMRETFQLASEIIAESDLQAPGGDDEERGTKFIGGRTNTWRVANGVFIEHNGSVWLQDDSRAGTLMAVPRSFVAMVLDLHITRRAAWIMCTYPRQARIPGSERLPLAEDLEACWDWGDNILLAEGNEAYKTIKSWESLFTGMMLAMGEDYNNSIAVSSFMDETIEGLTPKDRSFWRKIQRKIGNVHHLNELKGVFRSFGHPAVDGDKGYKALYKLSEEPIAIDHDLIAPGIAHFRKLFATSWRGEKGAWPKMDVTDLPRLSHLRWAVENDKDIEEGDPMYRKEDWYLVKMLRCFSPLSSVSVASLLADRSISPGLKSIEKHLKGKVRGSVGDLSERRLVCKYIRTEMVSVDEILAKFSERNWDKSWLAIALRPKEKELKMIPRMFAMLSWEARLYFVTCESMMALHILPHMKFVTMLDTEAEKSTKLHKYGKPDKNDELRWVAHADFDKWSSRQRYTVLESFFEEFGNLHGMRDLFTASHVFNSQATVYLQDGASQYRWDDGKLKENRGCSRSGFLGGFEGQSQKAWTVVTGSILSAIAESLNLHIQIMAAGDNIVFISRFSLQNSKRSEAGKLEVKRILGRLDNFLIKAFALFKKLGMPLKPSETWRSCSMIMYGKNIVYNGMMLGEVLKRIAKQSLTVNDAVQTVEVCLSANRAMGEDASATHPNPLCLYAFTIFRNWETSKFHMYEFNPLMGEPLVDQLKRQSVSISDTERIEISAEVISMLRTERDAASLALALCPNVIGGLSAPQLMSYVMRGFPDRTVLEVQEMRTMGRVMRAVYPGAYRFYEKITRTFLQPEIDVERLLEDPCSLNTESGPSPKRRLYDVVVSDVIKPHCKNTDMKELISLVDEMRNIDKHSREHTKIDSSGPQRVRSWAGRWKEELMTMSPMDPRAASEIYKCSIFGLIDSLIGKIVRTKTMAATALNLDTTDLLHSFGRAECKTLVLLFSKMKNISERRLQRECLTEACPVLAVQRARDRGWGVEIVNTTLCHPAHSFRKEEEKPEGPSNFITARRIESTRISEMWESNVDGRPYCGGITKEKILQAGGSRITIEDSFGAKALRSIRLIGFICAKDSNITKEILANGKIVTGKDLAEFVRTQDEMTQTAPGHRLHTTGVSNGAFIRTNVCVGNHLRISSDGLSSFGKGQANYNIMMQAQLLYSQFSASLGWRLGEQVPEVYFVARCPDCPSPIYEGKHEISRADILTKMCEEGREFGFFREYKKAEISETKRGDFPKLVLRGLSKAGLLEVASLAAGRLAYLKSSHHIRVEGVSETSLEAALSTQASVCHIFAGFMIWAAVAEFKRLSIRADCMDRATDCLINAMKRIERTPEMTQPLHTLLRKSAEREHLIRSGFAAATDNSLLTESGAVRICNEIFKKLYTDKRAMGMLCDRPSLECMETYFSESMWEELMIYSALRSYFAGRDTECLDAVLCWERAKDRQRSSPSTFKLNSDELKFVRIYRTEKSLRKLMSGTGKYRARLEVILNPKLLREQEKERMVSEYFQQLNQTSDADYHFGARVCGANKEPGVTRHVELPISHFYRYSKSVTSAPLKLEGILQTFCVGQRFLGPKCAIADGTGSFAASLKCLNLQLNDSSTVYYNTLVMGDKTVDHAAGELVCPASEMLLGGEESIDSERLMRPYSDVLSDGWRQQAHGLECKIVTCDAERVSRDEADWFLGLCDLYKSCSIARPTDGIIIVKSYVQSRGGFIRQLNHLKANSTHVWCIRSLFSGYGNDEVYWVASDSTEDFDGLIGSEATEESYNDLTFLKYEFPSEELIEGLNGLMEVRIQRSSRDVAIGQLMLFTGCHIDDLKGQGWADFIRVLSRASKTQDASKWGITSRGRDKDIIGIGFLKEWAIWYLALSAMRDSKRVAAAERLSRLKGGAEVTMTVMSSQLSRESWIIPGESHERDRERGKHSVRITGDSGPEVKRIFSSAGALGCLRGEEYQPGRYRVGWRELGPRMQPSFSALLPVSRTIMDLGFEMTYHII